MLEEEARIDRDGIDTKRFDLGLQRLHPALKAELRRSVRGTEFKTDQPAVEEIVIIRPERCFRINGRTARVTFIGPTRLVDS